MFSNIKNTIPLYFQMLFSELCTPLPRDLTSRIEICENSKQYVINFLQNLLPPSDCKSITDEMRKVCL